MKYIKLFEKMLKNTDDRVINHPLFSFSKRIADVMSEIKKLDNFLIERVFRSFVSDGDINISYFHLKITLSSQNENFLTDKIIKTRKGIFHMNVTCEHHVFANANKNIVEFFDFLEERFKEYVTGSKKNNFSLSIGFNFPNSKKDEIIEKIEEYYMILDTKKYNL